jgi:hypothetical protein
VERREREGGREAGEAEDPNGHRLIEQFVKEINLLRAQKHDLWVH